MNEEEAARRDTRANPPMVSPGPPESVRGTYPPSILAWPSKVMRTVAIALLTAAVVLGALLLLWQVRTFIGWFVVALFQAAALGVPFRLYHSGDGRG